MTRTPKLESVLKVAENVARELGHAYTGREHVLIAMTLVEYGVFSQSLKKIGITEEKARACANFIRWKETK